MATENFVSLSTVSLRLVKQPEHRPEFEKKLAQELRKALNVSEATPITTMPDNPLWWQRAKTIAQEMEIERKYAEEHPECAKSPNGKHEWRFGACIWCGRKVELLEEKPPDGKFPKLTPSDLLKIRQLMGEPWKAQFNTLDDIVYNALVTIAQEPNKEIYKFSIPEGLRYFGTLCDTMLEEKKLSFEEHKQLVDTLPSLTSEFATTNEKPFDELTYKNLLAKIRKLESTWLEIYEKHHPEKPEHLTKKAQHHSSSHHFLQER